MIVLDVESSGLDAGKSSILSIGALDLDEPGNQFYDECRAWEGAHIDDDALAVNGFTREEATDQARKSEAELIKAFCAWALDKPAEKTLASQNSAFDRAFVEAACDRADIEFPFAHRTIDTHSLVWMHMAQRGIAPPTKNGHSGISLTFALNYVGLPEEPRPHNGLTGAMCHAEIISRVAYNKKLLDDFSKYDIPWIRNET